MPELFQIMALQGPEN